MVSSICWGAINIVLASGRIGRPGCGYSTITGQGNGQGGREHGQKCDQLPGARDIEHPEHRKHIAAIWGVREDELPHAGVDCYELPRKVETGEVRGLLVWSFNPFVSHPGRFVAYGQKCSHLSCAVVPHFDKSELHCPCHNGTSN